MSEIWTSNIMWIILIVLGIITVYITYRIFNKEEKRQERLDDEDDSAKNEMERSLEYETTSITMNLKRLVWIYAITLPLSLIIFFIFYYIYYK